MMNRFGAVIAAMQTDECAPRVPVLIVCPVPRMAVFWGSAVPDI